MSYELCYASAQKGIKPGSSGFCTVAQTRGIPASLVDLLESLSFYTPLYPPGSPQAGNNPVNFAHWRASAGGQNFSVLSRICFAVPEHTQRLSVFAHHVAIPLAERPVGGPVMSLSTSGLMRRSWSGPPTEFPQGPALPQGDTVAKPCAAWATACGDAGWAGVLAEALVGANAKPVYVIYPPAVDMLALMGEAIALLPANQRWQGTFNTYFTQVRAEASCACRCCVAGSPAAAEAGRAGGLLIDLTRRMPGTPSGRFVTIARQGPGAVEESPAVNVLEGDDDPMAFSDEVIPVRTTPIAAPVNRPGPRKAAPTPVVASAPKKSKPQPAATESNPDAASSPRSGIGLVPAAAISVVVGLLCGGGAYFFAQQQDAVARDKAAAEFSRQITDRQDSLDQLKKNYAELEQAKKTADTENANELKIQFAAGQNSPDPKVWQRISEADGYTEKQLQEKVKAAVDAQRKADLALLHDPGTSTSTGPVHPAGESVVMLKPDGPLKQRDGVPALIFPLDGLPANPSEPQTFPVATVSGTAGGIKYSLVPPDPKGDGYCRYDTATGKITRASKALQGDVPLASFAVDGSSVVLRWEPLNDSNDDARRRGFLQTCLLTLTDSTGAAQSIQFVDPEKVQIALADEHSIPFKTPLANLPGQHVVLASKLPDDSPWQVEGAAPANSQVLLFSNSQTSQAREISLALDSGGIKSNFQDVWAKAGSELHDRENALKTWKSGLPEKSDGTVDWSRLQNDTGSKLLDDFNEKNKELDRDQKIVNAPGDFPPVKLLVKLTNEVTICRVTVRVKR